MKVGLSPFLSTEALAKAGHPKRSASPDVALLTSVASAEDVAEGGSQLVSISKPFPKGSPIRQQQQSTTP